MAHYEKFLLALSIGLSAWRPGYPAAIVCVSVATLVGLKIWFDKRQTDNFERLQSEIFAIQEKLTSMSLRGIR